MIHRGKKLTKSDDRCWVEVERSDPERNIFKE